MPVPITNRTSLIRGPALLTYNGGKTFTKEDLEIKVVKETLNIEDSAHGKVDERAIEIYEEASFVPDGRWNSSFLNAMVNQIGRASCRERV